MKKTILAALACAASLFANAQLTMPANGNSVRAKTAERIGLTDVEIDYGRPAVRGREGKVWGGLVHTGFQNLGFGTAKESPWRAGANENTTITFSTDVMVEGKSLKAGTYGFFVAYQPQECTLIFSKATTSWGSYFYDPAEDVLRVPVKPVALKESKERLTYEFSDETDSTAVINLQWEKLSIPFRVSTKLHELQMASFEREMRSEKGFSAESMVQYTEYLAEHNTELETALAYISGAERTMPGLHTSLTKATILEKMGKKQTADSVKQAAIAAGGAQEVHNYARGLLREGKTQEAYAAFQQNYKHYPKTYTTCMGMARGCSAMGKTKDALKYAQQALPMAPDETNKKAVEDMVGKLKEGKEI
ncbi:MAG: DUF2911 domain-containing protein [Taibaiella sp.]|nr:DUF2911 domain-containing protein [Taibaiella sp.]